MSGKTVLDQMQEIIKKSLPQQTAEQLKEYIAEQDSINKEFESLKKSCESYLKELEDYAKLDSEYHSLKNREKVLENKEHELAGKVLAHEESVRNLEVEKLKYQLAESTKRSDDAVRFVETLVRNPRSTEFWSSNKNTPQSYTDQYGNRMTDYHNVNETITKDVEEHK